MDYKCVVHRSIFLARFGEIKFLGLSTRQCKGPLGIAAYDHHPDKMNCHFSGAHRDQKLDKCKIELSNISPKKTVLCHAPWKV